MMLAPIVIALAKARHERIAQTRQVRVLPSGALQRLVEDLLGLHTEYLLGA